MAENQESREDLNGKDDDIADTNKIISDKKITSGILEEVGETPIDNNFINRWALGLTIFSFGFLFVGSFLFGATATTAVLRGAGGGALFGSLLWLTGTMLIQGENPIEKVKSQDK